MPYIHSNLKEHIAKLIVAMPELEQQVLDLLYVQELTLPEVSRVLSLPVSQVAMTHVNAVRRLNGTLDFLLDPTTVVHSN
jgi:DNA-directed RNA polymerase specialized sigma subunit